jgi:hypothetical protein
MFGLKAFERENGKIWYKRGTGPLEVSDNIIASW